MSETWPPPPPPPRDEDDPKTVFAPGGTQYPGTIPPNSTASPEPVSPPEPAGPDFTKPSPPSSPPPSAAPPPPAAQDATQFAPLEDARGIRVGDVLNHMFEVKRFIARGGMGEVFEAANVTSGERVAIKAILPALAADPNVIAMFRKEARTLTKLHHEALVQYRVDLVHEPRLGVLYIVTEFIDGTNLSEVLRTLKPSVPELIALLRRLASGLRAAHALGAIHRDMSADNILLEGGRLDRAKIIDFGIAKDLDPGTVTIINDGFAGKLSYVAPEQLGDYGRDIGTWTDVYSLALVIAALSLGRAIPLGGSLVDAVDKRRAGVDLTGVPEELRPILAKMLAPDPRDRLKTMDAVLEALDKVERALPRDRGKSPRKINRFAIGGAAAAIVLAGGVAAWLASGGGGDRMEPGARSGEQVVSGAPGDPVARARSIIDATLPSVACTWLEIVEIAPGDTGPLVKMTGVAGNVSKAQEEIMDALEVGKVVGATSNFDEVAKISQGGCAALETFHQIRATDSDRLATPQRKFEMRLQPNDPKMTFYPGVNAANAVIDVNIGDPAMQFALIAIDPAGRIEAEFLGAGSGVLGREGVKELGLVTDMGNDRYKMQLDVNHTGWSGVLLLTGAGPFPKELIGPPLGARGPDWTSRFVSTASERGWQADMVWFNSVDEVRE